MSKTNVTRLFLAGVIAVIAGVILELAAVWSTLSSGVFSIGGPTVVSFNGGSLSWLMVGLALTGFLAMAGGAIAGLVAWIGALLNTVQLEDKTWFLLLLVLGLLSFGFIAMVVYVFVGPDGTAAHAARPAAATGTQA
jgi:hypothetical protein